VVSDETAVNEAKCVRILLDSVQSHLYVVRNLAIFIEDQTYHFLYPRADTNLNDFLTSDGYAGSLDTPSSFVNIMPKIADLAHALRYLHQELRDPETGNQVFCHMDFRPENILITDTNKITDYKLIISDLGLSVYRDDPKNTSHLKKLMPNNTTKTRGRRGAGTYEAPEMDHSNYVGRKSDVWSLACIIIAALTRVIMGKERLAQFDKEREKCSLNEEDNYYYLCSRTGPPEGLNEAVKTWLSEFASKEGPFVNKLTSDLGLKKSPLIVTGILKKISSLIEKALTISERNRIGISDFVAGLDSVCHELRELTESPQYVLLQHPKVI